MAPRTLSLGVASHCYPGETVSGDCWAIDWDAATCRLSVIDGLGHGPEAAEAAERARRTLGANPTLSPAAAIVACQHALVGSRGAAILIVRVEPDSSRLSYAGAGNVEARLWQSGREQDLIGQRGIVGANIPSIRLYSLPLASRWQLLIYSDGIKRHKALLELPGFPTASAQTLAEVALQSWGLPNDDATILVAQWEDE